MNGRSAHGVMLAVTVVVMAACSGKDKNEREFEAKDRLAIDSARMATERQEAATPSELAGSTWRLVRLQSSDDTVFTPERNAVYTVNFGRDGTVSVVAGCNRGSGTWSTSGSSGLAFGPLATTRAMCPPGSMSARFLGDFQYMRSYVMVDGGLHVSLMADGGIYAFVPEIAPEVVASPDAPVILACADSTGARSRLVATFAPGTPARVTLTRKRETVVIPNVTSGSGAKYEGSGVMLWNKGRDAMVTWKGASLNCVVIPE